MKLAHKQHQRKLKEQNRIPAGEKYEKLRRLGPQPFSCAFRQHRSKPKPLVYVDVKVGHGRTGRVGVHHGDDFRVLSRNFAKTFQLDREAQRRLEGLLRQAYAWRAWQSLKRPAREK
eukprot:symbB.v1.2.000434.t1/scaffold32.1/size405148/7